MDNESDKQNGEEASQKQEEAQQKTVEDMITDLEKQQQVLEKANRDLKDTLLRTAADFDNFKKRTKKELDEAQQKGRESLLKEILPVLDNFERALKHAADSDPLAQGVKMVEKQLLAALEKFQVTRFSAQGQPFDPALHDAIQQVETSELPAGTVATEYSKGYMIGSKLLRAAMVAVAKAAEGEKKE